MLPTVQPMCTCALVSVTITPALSPPHVPTSTGSTGPRGNAHAALYMSASTPATQFRSKPILLVLLIIEGLQVLPSSLYRFLDGIGGERCGRERLELLCHDIDNGSYAPSVLTMGRKAQRIEQDCGERGGPCVQNRKTWALWAHPEGPGLAIL